jgi:hypothetical protein
VEVAPSTGPLVLVSLLVRWTPCKVPYAKRFMTACTNNTQKAANHGFRKEVSDGEHDGSHGVLSSTLVAKAYVPPPIRERVAHRAMREFLEQVPPRRSIPTWRYYQDIKPEGGGRLIGAKGQLNMGNTKPTRGTRRMREVGVVGTERGLAMCVCEGSTHVVQHTGGRESRQQPARRVGMVVVERLSTKRVIANPAMKKARKISTTALG